MKHRVSAWALAVGLALAAAGPAQARVEQLRWTHASPGAVTSFRVHWGTSSRSYTRVVDVGLPPSSGGVFTSSVEVPDEGNVYFAVTAFDGRSGASSVFSNERVRAGAAPDPDPDPPDPDPDPPDPDPPGPDPDPPDPTPDDPTPDEPPGDPLPPVGPSDPPPEDEPATAGFVGAVPPPLPDAGRPPGDPVEPPTPPPADPLGVPGQPQIVPE